MVKIIKQTDIGKETLKCLCKYASRVKIVEATHIDWYKSPQGKDEFKYNSSGDGETVWGSSQKGGGWSATIYIASTKWDSGSKAYKQLDDVTVAMTLLHEITHFCLGQTLDRDTEEDARLAEFTFLQQIMDKLSDRDKAAAQYWIDKYVGDGAISIGDKGKIIPNLNKIKELWGPTSGYKGPSGFTWKTEYGKQKEWDYKKLCCD